ncbi:hypothetical protein, partial [Natrinema pellirubrum]|uniref:hypothetical protein n=1 Tax=Natrinema pellirubrum TaxID=69525 RepID=UPI001F4CA0CE
MDVDRRVPVFDSVDLLLVGEVPERSVAASIEEIVGFGRSKPGGASEHEMLERGLGVFFAVEDGDAVIPLGSPEAVMGGTMADNVFASDVLTVMVQGGVEGVCRGNLVDIPRRHVGAGAELVFGGD